MGKTFGSIFGLEITSIPQLLSLFCINKFLLSKLGGWESSSQFFEVFEVMKKEQASSEMKLEQLELKSRDLLRRTNGSQHCLSDLSGDNTALAIS